MTTTLFFVTLLCLTLVTLVAFRFYFYFWKKSLINGLPQDTKVITTENGPIEYAIDGDSDKYFLMIHGTPGSVHTAKEPSLLNKGFTVLSVSRPGYYKTPLSSGKTPKEQAALYKSLLDKLNIDTVFVNAYSGGGPSGIEFALAYPERTAGLILRAAISEKIVEGSMGSGPLKIFFQLEFLIWLGAQVGLTLLSKKRKEALNLYMKRSLFPFEFMKAGLQNDILLFSNLENPPLEKIAVPTIIFHGDKDKNVPFAFAENAAKSIPNAIFVEMKGKDHYDFIGPYADTISQDIVKFVKDNEGK